MYIDATLESSLPEPLGHPPIMFDEVAQVLGKVRPVNSLKHKYSFERIEVIVLRLGEDYVAGLVMRQHSQDWIKIARLQLIKALGPHVGFASPVQCLRIRSVS